MKSTGLEENESEHENVNADPDSFVQEEPMYMNTKAEKEDKKRKAQQEVRKSADGGTILDPIYIQTPSGNENWELTWPIWHLLPHIEKKEIAFQNGFNTIGAFEEEVILSRALNENYTTSNGQEVISANVGNLQDSSDELEKKPGDVDDNESSTSSDDEDDDRALLLGEAAEEEDHKNVEEGGLILILPDELILHHIFPFLSTEYYAVCALVSSHWKGFTRSELAYKEICKRSYLNQSKRKSLHVARFGGSYRTMLETRNRVKTGCGCYMLKCSKIRKVQRDMWTELPHGVILETTYYRYLDFYEDGRVLYALTVKPPYEMIPRFLKVKSTGQLESPAVFGTYQIQKDIVTIDIQHPWHHVRIVLRVMKDGVPGAFGRFWSLEFVTHLSSASGNFDEYWSRDLVEYDIPPNKDFLFLRDWRL